MKPKKPHHPNPVMVGRAKSLRKRQPPPEMVLWAHLRKRRFSALKFRRQEPIGPYIVDFLCKKKWLIVEADGSQHGESNAQQYDHGRTLYLEKKGYRVLRFWNHHILNETATVLEVIHQNLQWKKQAWLARHKEGHEEEQEKGRGEEQEEGGSS